MIGVLDRWYAHADKWTAECRVPIISLLAGGALVVAGFVCHLFGLVERFPDYYYD